LPVSTGAIRKGVTVDDDRALLAHAGLPSDISADARAKLESWIERPISGAFTDAHKIIRTIFGQRLIGFHLRDDLNEGNMGLFRELFKGLDLESRIINVTELEDYGEDDRKLVAFLFAENRNSIFRAFGRKVSNYAFFVDDGTFIDDFAVLGNFDAFMRFLGRKERAFSIGYDHHGDSEHGDFVVAEPQGMRELADELRIKVEAASGDTAFCCALPTLHTCPVPPELLNQSFS
jgi:hypothetical protein